MQLMILVKPVLATCPVCVVAVGSGLWLAGKLGVDDLIAAIWIGALTTAIAVALGGKLRRIKLPKPEVSWTIVFYLLTLAVLKIQGKLGHPYCQIWGIDKIFLGLTIGTIVFWAGVITDCWLRTTNNGRAHFPFQKVILPLTAVLLISLIFHLIVC